MPFGLCNAPSTLQRAMDSVLAGLKWRTCIVYIDDILVFSKDFESHKVDLKAVLSRCRAHHLKLKLSKCVLASQELKYLGYVVNRSGVTVDPAKVRAVRELAPPTNRTLLKSFLGLTSYYRRFVKSYSDVTEPLYRLLRGNVSVYAWAAEQQRAFQAIKMALTTAPLLVHPDWTKPFKLQTDASDFAVAAILAQIDDQTHECVVSYASRQLSVDERKYDTREKELLAVVWGCETHAKYLGDQPFVIETDHSNLQWLMHRNPPRGRLARWIMRLQPFNMRIQHCAGRAKGNADALSRLPTLVEATKDVSIVAVTTRGLAIVPSLEQLLRAQANDPVIRATTDFLKYPTGQEAPPEVKEVLRDTGAIKVHPTSGVLVHEAMTNGEKLQVPFLPAALRSQVLEVLHSVPMSVTWDTGRR
eukprot:m.294421 g.294421  ORF g.294421 m.294421 type:complete len:416 (+) comp40746_c0_seq7:423-1670(+)